MIAVPSGHAQCELSSRSRRILFFASIELVLARFFLNKIGNVSRQWLAL